MNLLNEVKEYLAANRVEQESFQRIICKLFAEGSLVREQSQVNTKLYDSAIRIDELLKSYFALIGIELVCEEDLGIYRLKPPSSNDDQKSTDEGLAKKPSANFAAFIAALWLEYEEAYRAGELNDSGNALVTMSKVTLTMASRLDRQLPEGLGEIRAILKEAVNLNILTCNLDDNPKSESYILEIGNLITRLISAQDLIELVSENEISKASESITSKENNTGDFDPYLMEAAYSPEEQ